MDQRAKAAEPTQMSLVDAVSWILIYKLIGWGFDCMNLSAMAIALLEKPKLTLDQARACDDCGKESEVDDHRRPISQTQMLNLKRT